MTPQSFRRELGQAVADGDLNKTRQMFDSAPRQYGQENSAERRANILNSLDRLRGGGANEIETRETEGNGSLPLLRPAILDGASRQPARQFGTQDRRGI